MNDHTVLVVDAGQETEEKIVSTLEVEGYLVFTASGRDVSSGLAEKISPELIYLQPTSNSVEGFAVCKAIHNTEKFRNVPIILLASLKGPLDSRYTTFYGIVDYLSIPVNAAELIEKTGNILCISSSDFQIPEEDIWPVEVADATPQEQSKIQNEYAIDAGIHELSDIAQSGEEDIGAVEEENVIAKVEPDTQSDYAIDTQTDKVSDIGEPKQDYTYIEDQNKLKPGFSMRGHRRRPKKSGLLIPLIVVAVLVAIAAAGFLFYQLYLSPAEVKTPVAVKAPRVVQPQEPAVLPSQEQQKQEHPVVEERPVKTIEAPKGAPEAASKETPKETPVAKTEVKPAAKQVSKLLYSVQLGAFKNEGSAEALAKTFKGKGYEAFTYTETTKDKGTIHRVLIGKFEIRKEALQHASQIHTKEKVNTTVFSEAIK